MKKNICKMAELSTAHLSPETLSMIEDGEIMEVSIYKKTVPGEGVVGYFIPIIETTLDDPGIPGSLKEAMKYAANNGCSWLMFDRDIEPIPDLPAYF